MRAKSCGVLVQQCSWVIHDYEPGKRQHLVGFRHQRWRQHSVLQQQVEAGVLQPSQHHQPLLGHLLHHLRGHGRQHQRLLRRRNHLPPRQPRPHQLTKPNRPSGPPLHPPTPTLQITDTGNLIQRDHTRETTIWQSFSQPCDVFVPTMTTSHNIHTGKKLVLSAWSNATDPHPGRFTSGLDVSHIPQNVIWRDGLAERPHFYWYM